MLANKNISTDNANIQLESKHVIKKIDRKRELQMKQKDTQSNRSKETKPKMLFKKSQIYVDEIDWQREREKKGSEITLRKSTR